MRELDSQEIEVPVGEVVTYTNRPCVVSTAPRQVPEVVLPKSGSKIWYGLQILTRFTPVII